MPRRGAPKWPKIRVQPARALKAMVATITHSPDPGLADAGGEAAQNLEAQREGQAQGDHGDELAGVVGQHRLLVQGEQDRLGRPHDGITGSEMIQTAHRPMRSAARTPPRLPARSPRIWAIIGATAKAGPPPSSQANQ